MIHIVRPGDGISSLAELYGFAPQTLWEHPANAELKATRKDGNVLSAGDRVFIPEKRIKTLDVPTGKRHVFRRLEVPARFRLQLFRGGEPRADEPFELTVDGRTTRGRTGADGVIDVFISPRAQRGRLLLGLEPPREELDLSFGFLEPHTLVVGAQQRLRNMGFYEGEPNGLHDDASRQATAAFRAARGMPEGDELDGETLEAIAAAHDERGAIRKGNGP